MDTKSPYFESKPYPRTQDRSSVSHTAAPCTPRGIARTALRAQRRRSGMKFDPGWPTDYKATHPGFWRRKGLAQFDCRQVSVDGEHVRMSNGQVLNPTHQKIRDMREDRRRNRRAAKAATL